MIARRLGNKWETADPNTLLLLHGEDFTDSSQYAVPLTNEGATISSSGKFDSCFSLSGVSRIKFQTTLSGIYTVECWVKFTTINRRGLILGSYPVAPNLNIEQRADNTFRIWYSGTPDIAVSGVTIAANRWYHIALVMTNSNLKFFVDGTLRDNRTVTQLTFSNEWFGIGRDFRETGYETTTLQGCVDELRISNVARWTGNFTPPTAPYTK